MTLFADNWEYDGYQKNLAARKAKQLADYEAMRKRNAEIVDLERIREGTAGNPNPKRQTIQKSRLDLIEESKKPAPKPMRKAGAIDMKPPQQTRTIANDSVKKRYFAIGEALPLYRD